MTPSESLLRPPCRQRGVAPLSMHQRLEVDSEGRLRRSAGLPRIRQTIAQGPWDPTKIPRIRIWLPHASSLVDLGGVPLDQLDD